MAKSGKSLPDVQDGKPKKPPKAEKSFKEDSMHVVPKTTRATTPVSILIESLVKNLCFVYENDKEKAAIMYNLICDRLFQMNLIDESYNMNEFEGMRIQYQRAFCHLVKSALGNDKPIPMRPAWPNYDLSSHYCHEFDEIEYIAGGGFGQVFRVKHKLDGTEYAVKKIPIRAEGIESVKNYLSEVKTFASLNHSNIVQYKAAWLELGVPNGEKIISASSESDYTFSAGDSLERNSVEYLDDDVGLDMDEAVLERRDDSSDFQVDFENSGVVTQKHYSHSIDDICMIGKAKRQKRDSVSEGGKAICKVNFQEMHELKIQSQGAIKWATLYIQMALCQSTLKQWLEKRNSSDEDNSKALIPINGKVRNDTIMEILVQLLKGLEYIHFKGIVHHDIKPSNIFVQLENGALLVQLGDFGLACPLQSARHSLAFGTKLYAAPEQLAGKCDPKSDMYSLGIVLLELVETFRTDMERVQTITELRKGHLPSYLPLQQPQFARIIGQLVCRSPENRPDATALLKHITANAGEAEHVQELERRLAEKDEEILRLKELLKSAGVKSI